MPNCVKCGQPHSGSTKRCAECTAKNTVLINKRRNELRQNGLCYDCRGKVEPGKLRCSDCLELGRQSIQKSGQRNKLGALKAYGGASCACCGETLLIMLTLDHIAQDGALKRRTGEASGSRFYQILKKQGYPPGLRVLCRNCNYAVYVSPNHRCPHGTGCFEEVL